MLNAIALSVDHACTCVYHLFELKIQVLVAIIGIPQVWVHDQLPASEFHPKSPVLPIKDKW